MGKVTKFVLGTKGGDMVQELSGLCDRLKLVGSFYTR